VVEGTAGNTGEKWRASLSFLRSCSASEGLLSSLKLRSHIISTLSGIGLAHMCLASGYKCVIYMPNTQSQVCMS
jgi:cysteine synthase A